MPRSLRNCPGGYIFHVLNRANSRNQIFNNNFDYQKFLEIVRQLPGHKGPGFLENVMMNCIEM